MTALDAAERAPAGRVAATAEVVGLVAIQLVLLWGFRDALDLHPYDEPSYLLRGVALLEGKGWAWQLEWGPFYSICYALLAALPLGGVVPLDAMLVLVAVGSTLALWWALRAFLPSSLAFLLALWWAASPELTSSDLALASQPSPRPMVNAFGLLLWAIAVGLVARRRLVWALPVVVLLFFTRPETGALTALAGALLLGAGCLRRRRELVAPGAAWLAVGALLVAFAFQHAGIRERVWYNFGQNFAWNAWVRAGRPPIGPTDLTYIEPWLRPAFPTAESVAKAALENPREFLAHVALNARDVPGGFAPSLTESFEQAPWVRRGALALAALLCLVGLARRAPCAVFARCPAALWLVLAASLSTLPSLLVMNVQDRLVLPLLPGILAALGCALVAGWRRLLPRPLPRVVALVVPAAALLGVALLPPLFTPARAPLVHRVSTRVVRELVLDEPLHLVATNGWAYLLLAEKEHLRSTSLLELSLDEETRGLPFVDLVAKLAPDLVLVSPLVAPFDDVHRGLLAELESPRWRRFELAPGFAFAVRATLAPPPLDLERLAQQRAPGGALSGLTRGPTLDAQPPALSQAAGGAQHFRIDAGAEHALAPYVLFGALADTPLGPPYAALLADPYFQLTLAGGGGLLEGGFGRLDAAGRATARLTLPAGLRLALVGMRVRHAFAVLGPDAAPLVQSDSKPLRLEE